MLRDESIEILFEMIKELFVIAVLWSEATKNENSVANAAGASSAAADALSIASEDSEYIMVLMVIRTRRWSWLFRVENLYQNLLIVFVLRAI